MGSKRKKQKLSKEDEAKQAYVTLRKLHGQGKKMQAKQQQALNSHNREGLVGPDEDRVSSHGEFAPLEVPLDLG